MQALAWRVCERRFPARPPRRLRSELLEVRWAGGVCHLALDGSPVARWCPRAAKVEAFVHPEYRVSWLRLLRWMLRRSDNEVRGGGTLHASAILLGGKAFLCCGPSGVGKSTLYRFAGARARVCDEFCDVVHCGGRYAVLDGGGLQAGARTAVPIGGLLFPRHARTAKLLPLAPALAAARVLENSHLGLWYHRHVPAALEFAAELCTALRTYELRFPLQRSVIGWLERSLPA